MDISLYTDGEQATAAVLNRPLNQIKGAVDAIENGDKIVGNANKIKGLSINEIATSNRYMEATMLHLDGYRICSDYKTVGANSREPQILFTVLGQADWGAGVYKVTLRDIYHSGSTSEQEYLINCYYDGYSVIPIGDASPDLLYVEPIGLRSPMNITTGESQIITFAVDDTIWIRTASTGDNSVEELDSWYKCKVAGDYDVNDTDFTNTDNWVKTPEVRSYITHYSHGNGEGNNPNNKGHYRNTYGGNIMINVTGTYNGYMAKIEIFSTNGVLRGIEDYSIIEDIKNICGNDYVNNTTDELSNSLSTSRGTYLNGVSIKEDREERL